MNELDRMSYGFRTQLRVCFLVESYYPVVGGMETQTKSLAGALKRRGLSLFIVTRRPAADLKRQDKVDGIPVYRVEPTGASSRLRWGMVVRCLPHLWRMRDAYDVIFVPGFRALGLAAVIMGRMIGKPVVLKGESCGELSGTFFAGWL